MDPSLRPWELPDPPEVDELRLLGALPSVPTVEISLGRALDVELAREKLGASTWALVRAPTTSTSGTPCLTLLDASAPPSAELEAAVSCAAALFGLSASRFGSTLPSEVRAGTVSGADAALLQVARAAGVDLKAPSFERLAVVCAHLAGRAPNAPLLVQGLSSSRRFGSLLSRDGRTGAGPCRSALFAGPSAALEGRRPQSGPLEPDSLPPALHARATGLATELELELGRPVRVALELDGDDLRLVTVHASKRPGLCAFGLVHDLVRGGFPAARALRLIGAEDARAAAPLRVDVSASESPVTGIAAGPGIAEGRVCLSPSSALALSKIGLAPILFVHDIEPEDLDAVRASAGVVAVRGGLTGEAAVVARGLGKPCVASGAALSLGPDHVRVGELGTLREGDRVTIDGTTGLIVRGAHTRSMPPPSPTVVFVLSLLGGDASDVVAAVDHPAHVVTASRLGARRLVLALPEAILLDAAAREGEELDVELSAIFDAASGTIDRVYVVPPRVGAALPAPFARRVDEATARAFVDAALRAAERAGVRVVLGEEAASAAASACAPDAALGARIRASLP